MMADAGLRPVQQKWQRQRRPLQLLQLLLALLQVSERQQLLQQRPLLLLLVKREHLHLPQIQEEWLWLVDLLSPLLVVVAAAALSAFAPFVRGWVRSLLLRLSVVLLGSWHQQWLEFCRLLLLEQLQLLQMLLFLVNSRVPQLPHLMLLRQLLLVLQQLHLLLHHLLMEQQLLRRPTLWFVVIPPRSIPSELR